MSKKFKGKLCVYCRENPSTGPDHVFAREFFLPERRHNLPKVPACAACNFEKSKLEHYLVSVLPFGGRHADSLTNLSKMVEPRLAKNQALHRHLEAGRSVAWLPNEAGILIPSTGLPIESGHIEELFRYIVGGLMFHHWRVLIPKEIAVWTGILSEMGDKLFEKVMTMNGARAHGNLGDGTFVYEGIQSVEQPHMTVWTFSIYGGLVLGDDPNEPTPRKTMVGGLSGSGAFMKKLEAMIQPTTSANA